MGTFGEIDAHSPTFILWLGVTTKCGLSSSSLRSPTPKVGPASSQQWRWPTGQHRPFERLPQDGGSCCFSGPSLHLWWRLGSRREKTESRQHRHYFGACSNGGWKRDGICSPSAIWPQSSSPLRSRIAPLPAHGRASAMKRGTSS